MPWIKIHLNGKEAGLEINEDDSLFAALKKSGLLGPKMACDGLGLCGACTVLIDGRPHNSCLYPVLWAEGACVLTRESLLEPGRLGPIGQAYLEAGAVQCGYCTPGLIMTSKAFVEKNRYRAAEVDDREIMAAHQGHFCRCTGYEHIRRAVRLALDKS